MLVEGVACGVVAAVAGGVTGGFIGRALSSPEIAPRPVPRFALPAALVALVAVVAYATPVTAGDPVRAQVTLTDAKPPPEREVNVARRARPAGRGRGRRLVRHHRVAGQGGPFPGRRARGGLARRLPQHRARAGVRRLEVDAAPAQGLRDPGPRRLLPRGQGDPGQGRARPSRAFTRSFKRDKKLLQREQKSGRLGRARAGAYLIVLLIGLGLYGSMGWGLALMQQRLATRAVRA